jgi:hypothetical protein
MYQGMLVISCVATVGSGFAIRSVAESVVAIEGAPLFVEKLRKGRC